MSMNSDPRAFMARATNAGQELPLVALYQHSERSLIPVTQPLRKADVVVPHDRTLRRQGCPTTLAPYWPRQGASCLVDPDGYLLIVVPSGSGSGGEQVTHSRRRAGVGPNGRRINAAEQSHATRESRRRDLRVA
jgi:hypothetical protein